MTDYFMRDETLAMAVRVLDDEGASHLRRQWAQDVQAWLLRGDMAAAARCWYAPAAQQLEQEA